MILFFLGLTTLAGEQSPHAGVPNSPEPTSSDFGVPVEPGPWYETAWVIVPLSHAIWMAAVVRAAVASPADIFRTLVSTAVPLLASALIGYFGWRLTNSFRRRYVIQPLLERRLIDPPTAHQWARPTPRTVIVAVGLSVYVLLHFTSVNATLDAARELEPPPAWADASISGVYYAKTLVMTMALVAISLSLISFLHRSLDLVRRHAIAGSLPRQTAPADHAWGWSPLRSHAGCIGIGALAAIAMAVLYARIRMGPMLHVDTVLVLIVCVALAYHALAIGWRLHQGYTKTKLSDPGAPYAEDLASYKTELAVAVTAAIALLSITAPAL